jgi:hypothetical protein
MMPRNERSSSKSGQCSPKGEISMLPSCSGVPRVRRGFSWTGKRTSAPLRIVMMISPPEYAAAIAVSTKVLMPLLQYKSPVIFSKLLGASQLSHFHALRLAQLHLVFDVKHRLSISISYVDVNRPMFIAVEEKLEAILLEYLGHRRSRTTRVRAGAAEVERAARVSALPRASPPLRPSRPLRALPRRPTRGVLPSSRSS